MYDIEQRRTEAIEHLTECFSRDILTIEDYENRIAKINMALTITELDELTADVRTVSSLNARSYSDQVFSAHEKQRVLSLLGSQNLAGNWLKGNSAVIQALMGSVKCDLRDTIMQSRTHIQVYSIMSEIKIHIPKGIIAVNNISPIFSDVRNKTETLKNISNVPVIEFNGIALMSEIKIYS